MASRSVRAGLAALLSVAVTAALCPVTSIATEPDGPAHMMASEEAEPVTDVGASEQAGDVQASISEHALDAQDERVEAMLVTQASAEALGRGNLRDEFNDGATETDVEVSHGLYMVKAWGAKGGGTANGAQGGAGGYSVAVTPLDASTLYVFTGGEGVYGSGKTAKPGGANGGGAGGASYNNMNYNSGGSGGGATHIATASGTLASFSTQAGVASSVLIVAGGGGGGGHIYNGGAGGGATGQDASNHYHWASPMGGRQEPWSPTATITLGTLGTGADGAPGGAGGTGSYAREGKGGGGGGYFGGCARAAHWKDNQNSGGAGGSGFLNDGDGFIDGAKAEDGGSVSIDGRLVATTAQGGNSGAGKASMEYIASVVDLDNQGADEGHEGSSTVYSAPWADEYFLTYDVNGLGPQKTSIVSPTREGWTFKGYYTEKDGAGTRLIDESGVIQDGLYDLGSTTLYAWWWPNVTFDANGVETTGVPTMQVVQPGTAALRPADPSGAMVFRGWSTDKDAYREYSFEAATGAITGPTTLYAFWTPYVTFETYGLGDPVEAQFLTSGSYATKPADPSEPGYSFQGWFTTEDPTATEEFDFERTPVTADTVLYARWAANHYTATFMDGDEERGVEEFTYDDEAKPLKTAAELGLSREGWRFAGWRVLDDLAVDFTDGQEVRNLTTRTGTVYFHAVWERDIRFVSGADELAGQSDAATMRATSGALATQASSVETRSQLSDRTSFSSVLTPALAEVAGWRSVGWLASEAAASAADFDAGATITPQGTDTFYGIYNRDVTLVYEGGEGATGSVESLTEVQRLNASGELTPVTYVLSANGFAREGWRFAGWDIGSPGDAVTLKPAASDPDEIVAAAEWMGPYEYAISFDANGGQGAMGVQVIPEHVARQLDANTFTREEYAFAGWNTRADGTGTAYADQAEVEDLAEAGETITLYAQWTPSQVPERVDPTRKPSDPASKPSDPAVPRSKSMPATGDGTASVAGLMALALVGATVAFVGRRVRRDEEG